MKNLFLRVLQDKKGMQYSLLSDVWEIQPQPKVAVENPYKSKQYQQQFLNVPTDTFTTYSKFDNIGVKMDREQCVSYLKNLYDEKGFIGLLTVLPEQFVAESKEYFGSREGFTNPLSNINMDTVIALILIGVVIYILSDVLRNLKLMPATVPV